MLQIIVHTADGGREALDLLPDTSLGVESTSPLFDEALSEGSFSYPIDVPFSERNRRILGAPELLESVSATGLQYWTVDVYEAGLPCMQDVKLTLLGHKGAYDYKRGAYTMTVSGNESRFGTLIAGKTLRSLKLGGAIQLNQYVDSRQWAYNRMAGFLPQYDYIRFAPVYWPGFIDTSREDYSTEFVAGDIVNAIVLSAGQPYGWTFGRVNPATGSGAVGDGTQYYPDYRTVPFFTLHYVLRAVFREHGYECFGDFLDDADYKDIVIFNNSALEIYSAINFDLNRAIYPTRHVPDIPIAAFLEALQTAFGMAFVFAPGNKVQIKYRDAVMRSRDIVNVTSRTLNSYTADKPDVATGGLKMEWSWDGKEDFHSDRVKSVDVTKQRASVNLQADLAGIGSTGGLSDGDLAYVLAENAWYEWRYGGWSFYSEWQNEKTVGNGEKSISPHISPLCQLASYQIDGTTVASDMVATRQKGTYYNHSKTPVSEDFDLRIFYAKSLPATGIGGPGLPTSFSHNLAPLTGIKRVQTSLSWNAPSGLYERHHRRWVGAQLSGWYVQASFDLKPYELEQLPFGSKVQIGSVQYVVQKLKPVMGKGSGVSAVLLKI